MQELTRRLIASEAAQSTDAAAAAHAALERAYRSLSRWVGPAGARALFARALIETSPTHPAVAALELGDAPEMGLGGLAASVGAHGTDATAAGLEATLTAALRLLGRLIGDDVATRLLDPPRGSDA